MRARTHFHTIGVLIPCAAFALILGPGFSAAAPPAAIRVFLPSKGPLGTERDKQINSAIEEFNASHPASPVELSRRGEDFSAMRDLIAGQMISDAPDIAAIECSERPALSVAPALEAAGRRTIAFERVSAVLAVDQEMMFRVGADPLKLPHDWPALSDLAARFEKHFREKNDSTRWAASLPLTGARGLWFFEALAGLALWKREPGGLRSNRELSAPIAAIQKLLESSARARVSDSWEKAVQDFVERRSPILLTSTDAIPYIEAHAEFRFASVPLPRPTGGTSSTLTGSDWVVVKDRPEVRGFLALLAKRGLTSEKNRAPCSRSTDRDVVRDRTVWAQLLPRLFSEPQTRLSPADALAEADTRLNSPSGP